VITGDLEPELPVKYSLFGDNGNSGEWNLDGADVNLFKRGPRAILSSINRKEHGFYQISI